RAKKIAEIPFDTVVPYQCHVLAYPEKRQGVIRRESANEESWIFIRFSWKPGFLAVLGMTALSPDELISRTPQLGGSQPIEASQPANPRIESGAGRALVACPAPLLRLG
ncbi:MAG TPA: hypothetical protein VMI09_16885, partial [Candidatus Binataceae bacterium]|nr:hypothetical protein [Candidatus Binataceae bacterium]